MVATTTPKTIGTPIRELCSRLKATTQPQFLRVEPRSDSALGDCFNDVKRHVQEYGGSLVHGWLLWEWPGILVEAEFHGVWRSPAGELVDVAMKGEGEKIILFVADKLRVFDGIRIDNIRHAVGKDPSIRTFIQNQNRFFKLFQAKHGNAVGEIELDDELAELMFRQKQLGQELAASPAARKAWAARISARSSPHGNGGA